MTLFLKMCDGKLNLPYSYMNNFVCVAHGCAIHSYQNRIGPDGSTENRILNQSSKYIL